MTRTLLSLSPELLLDVSQSLSSATDLYALIRTSSRFYRLFTSYPHSITASILQRAVPAEIEADFLSAYRAQDIWQYVPEGNDDPFSPKPEFDINSLRMQTTMILEETTIRRSGNLHLLVSDYEALPKIWTFYSKVEHLMFRYTTSALEQLSLASNMPPVSLSEEIRLTRAFFRGEIYICLFQVSQMTHQDTRFPAPSTDPAATYIKTLRTCEIEQVYCVLQFYTTLVEQICEQMEDELVSPVRAKQLAYRPRKGEHVWRNTVDLFLDYHCLFWYEDSYRPLRRREHNAYIVSRGTLAMWKLTHIPYVAARKIFVYTWQTAYNKPSILFHLESLPRRTLSEPTQHCDGINDFGWPWAWGDTSYYRLYGLPSNYALRELGYVFWDKTRLEGFPPFSAPRSKERGLDELPPGYTDHVDTPGVVARLGDLKVDVQVVTEISDEILHESQPPGTEDHNKANDSRDPKNEKDKNDEKGIKDGKEPGDERNAEDEENPGNNVDADDIEHFEDPEEAHVPYVLRWRD